MRFLIPPLLFLAACGQAGASTTPDAATVEPVQLTLSLYIVDEVGNPPGSGLSSDRDAAGVGLIADGIQEIWEPARIGFAVTTITRIEASSEVLSALGRGDTSGFLDELYNGSIAAPGPGNINGFYVANLGTINGVAPFGSRVFFVTDTPSVHDERVSSHEIGHILGLRHTSGDSGRLMFSGTNGMELAQDEIAAARYTAGGITDGAR